MASNLPKILVTLTGVAALSLAYPAAVQANVMYTYQGPTFFLVTGPYTTSDFVEATLELRRPLPKDFSGFVSPRRWRVSDGVQTISPGFSAGTFFFVTDADANIIGWRFRVFEVPHPEEFHINSAGDEFTTLDFGVTRSGFGFYVGPPGPVGWSLVPDAGSALSLMSLTLVALSLVARRFKLAAA